ncbi:MAG: serine/threonine protein kinase [Lentisphaeraceae bacterium]|nr:serine/threonine protein kinase [Lentisphaeraceae bacterium]
MSNKEYEKTYRSMNDDLAAFFEAPKSNISEDDLRYAYPIQYDLANSLTQYIEHELIGEGGVKRIIRVTDNRSDRSVAKAVPLKESGKEGVEAFLREARLTASLQHPNIIPIYDMGLESSGLPYFIMEHLTGDTLGDVIKKLASGDKSYLGRYKLSALLDIFASICNAIEYAHSRNIIHLDIKPENIHINSYGQVHVCDWGLGKILTAEAEPEQETEEDLSKLDPDIINTMTLNGEIKGTPGFMAPEQTIANGTKDKRTDIYSLGALLYNMLSFHLPIDGKTAEELIRNTRTGEVRSLKESTVEIPESLVAITCKALRKEPSERYSSVEELRQDLDKYRHGYATSAENAGFFIQFKLLIKRNKTTSMLVAFFILLIVSIALLSFQRIKNEKDIALAAKIEAQKQQKKAEDSLSLFLTERQLTLKQGKDIDLLLEEISTSQNLANPTEQISILEQGLQREYSSEQKQEFYKKLGLLHFILQNFSASAKYIALINIEDQDRKLLTVSRQYAKIKKDNELLQDKQLAKIIDYLSFHQRYMIPSLFAHHMTVTSKHRREPKAYWPLAKAMLIMVNNYWNTEPLDRDLEEFEDGYALDLSHTRYREFRSHSGTKLTSVLAPLKLRKLNLRYTPFFEFWQLSGLRLKEINLDGCWVREIDLQNIDSLIKMGLKKITLDSSLYSEEAISHLRKYFTVVDTHKP